jgi:diguanylate cyclase (GGDEF)-like protein
MALEVKVKKIIDEIYIALSDYYIKLEDYRNALEYFKLHAELKDTMFTEDIRKKISRLQNKYELESKEREKEIYRLKNVELVKANESLLRANEQIQQQNKDIMNAYKKLELMAKTDYLTKLWNRMYILEKIEHEKLRFKETGQPFVLIISDIDYFKKFNDEYGHECGDFVLASLAKDMSCMIREIDCLARWGGEEFLLFLPGTSLDEGYKLAEKIRKTIADKVYVYNGLNLSITLTFGVYEYAKEESIEHCINLADEALYEGKRSTRNCVVKAKG